MKCPNCENEVSELAHFCPVCGHEIGGDFCAVCGKPHGNGGGSKIDRYIFLAILVGVAGWLGYEYYRGHTDEVNASVTAGIQNLQEQGTELLNQGLEVSAGIVAGTTTVDTATGEIETEVVVVEEETPVETDYSVVTENTIESEQNATHDMRAIVGPDLTQEELGTIAHAILDDLIIQNPADIFVLTVYDGEPSGDITVTENDPNFVAKFLYLNRLHAPDMTVPDDYKEIDTNFFVRWDEN